MYRVVREGNLSTLYRCSKSSENITIVCRVIDTPDNNRLLLVSNSVSGYVFKGKHTIAYKHIGGDKIAVVVGDIKVLKTPHHATLHNEIIKNNRLRYWLGSNNSNDRVLLDNDRLFYNMLECIATI